MQGVCRRCAGRVQATCMQCPCHPHAGCTSSAHAVTHAVCMPCAWSECRPRMQPTRRAHTCSSASSDRRSVASGVCGSSGVGTPLKTSRRLVTRVSTSSGSSGPRTGQRARQSTAECSSVGSERSRKESSSVAKEAEQLGASQPPTTPGRHLVASVKSEYSTRKPPVCIEKRRDGGGFRSLRLTSSSSMPCITWT